jgi:hypothetical protein
VKEKSPALVGVSIDQLAQIDFCPHGIGLEGEKRLEKALYNIFIFNQIRSRCTVRAGRGRKHQMKVPAPIFIGGHPGHALAFYGMMNYHEPDPQ